MIVPVVILDLKADDTPGDPVPVNTFVDAIRCFVSSSSGYSGSGDLVLQVAESDSGPWFSLPGTIPVPAADGLSVDSPSGIGNTFIPWMRGKLNASPSMGTVSAKIYMKPTLV